jgi:hypothetical protein
MVNIKVESPKTTVKNTPTKPQDIREERRDAVDGIFQLIGLGFIVTGQYADAGAISMHSPPISQEVAELAEKDERIAKGVDTLLQVGPYAGLVAAVMPLVLQLLVNHNVFPADKMASANIVKPEVLESQVKTDMARKAMQALQMQKDAEEELAKMQAEYMASQNGQEPNANS